MSGETSSAGTRGDAVGESLREVLRDGILRSPQPAVFRGLLQEWPLASYTLDDWARLFGDQLLSFRVGKMKVDKPPQWERCCDQEQLTLADFLLWQDGGRLNDDTNMLSCRSPRDNWAYFDYKYMHQVFHSHHHLLKTVDWSTFGFPDVDGNNSTLWIGSRGAYTPCHYDQYGCNLVAQLVGRKRWLLFPPEETKCLYPTRIPYEESSVYSSLGFSTRCLPNHAALMNSQCIAVDLQPGEVLYVPPQWWHYVEHLEVSVSINTWIPHHQDDEKRVGEALVKWLMGSLSKVIPLGDSRNLLNPNEDDLLDTPTSVLQGFVEMSLRVLEGGSSDQEEPEHKRRKMATDGSAFSWELVARSYECVFPLHLELYQAVRDKLHSLTAPEQSQIACEEEDSTGNLHLDKSDLCQMIVKAFSHPRVIHEVQDIFKSQFLAK